MGVNQMESKKVENDGIKVVMKTENGKGAAILELDLTKINPEDAIINIRKTISEATGIPEENIATDMKEVFEDISNSIIHAKESHGFIMNEKDAKKAMKDNLDLIVKLDNAVNKLNVELNTLEKINGKLYTEEIIQIINFLLHRFTLKGKLLIIKKLIEQYDKESKKNE